MGIVDGTLTENSTAMSKEDLLVWIHNSSISLEELCRKAGLQWHELRWHEGVVK